MLQTMYLYLLVLLITRDDEIKEYPPATLRRLRLLVSPKLLVICWVRKFLKYDIVDYSPVAVYASVRYSKI